MISQSQADVIALGEGVCTEGAGAHVAMVDPDRREVDAERVLRASLKPTP